MANRALLVGINAYPGAPLAGCINDVSDVAAFLVRSCGFSPADIRIVADGRATTTAIRERLAWLVSGTRAGDKLLYWFSGHGAQVASRAGSGEVDGLDEIQCPQDFDWTDTHMVRDKQIGQIFSSTPPGVLAWFVSDSCHSGGLSRNPGGLGGRRVRTMPAPVDMAWRLRTAEHLGIKAPPASYPHVALISGCRSDQTAADATFGRRPNGALTYFLLKELAKPGALSRPMPQILEGVRTALRRARFSQIPQLEGPNTLTNRPFLR